MKPVENYHCDDYLGFEVSKETSSGKHTLMFEFGDETAYAYNDVYQQKVYATDWFENGVTITSPESDGYNAYDNIFMETSGWGTDNEDVTATIGDPTQDGTFGSLIYSIIFNASSFNNDDIQIEYNDGTGWTASATYFTPTNGVVTTYGNYTTTVDTWTKANNFQVRLLFNRDSGADGATIDIDGVEVYINYTPSEAVAWNQSSLNLGTGNINEGYLNGSAKLISTQSNINVTMLCSSGDCSIISTIWDNTTDMSNAEESLVNFTCTDNYGGSLSAIFNVTSVNDTTPNQITVTCEIINPVPVCGPSSSGGDIVICTIAG